MPTLELSAEEADTLYGLLEKIMEKPEANWQAYRRFMLTKLIAAGYNGQQAEAKMTEQEAVFARLQNLRDRIGALV